MRLPCHLPVFYRNHSSASWWQVPRRFPGSFMRSGCSSSWSWFKCVPCSLIPLWNRGVEAQRSGTPAFRGLGASCPQHRGSGTGLCCRLSPSPKHLFNPSSCTPKPTVRTSVAFLSKTEHSLAQEENRVGKLCHSAIWWYLPDRMVGKGWMLSRGPWLRRRETHVPSEVDSVSFFFHHNSLGHFNQRSHLLYKPSFPSREHWASNLRFWLEAQVKGLAKKVMHVWPFLLLRSGPEGEFCLFVFKQLFILLPLNFQSEEVFLFPPLSFRVFVCIASLFGFTLFIHLGKMFY